MPALYRYDGPLFRVLRKAMRESEVDVRTWVLSAKYGLISGDEPIHNYDHRMTVPEAMSMHDSVVDRLRDIFGKTPANGVFVSVAGPYETRGQNHQAAIFRRLATP